MSALHNAFDAHSRPHTGMHMRMRTRMQQWWVSKLPRSSSHTITRRNLYLLPTSAGCMMAATLLVLLVASINFQLNLGFLLTFMLTGSALVSVGLGYRNLLGLQLQIHTPTPQFAHQPMRLALHIHNPGSRTRYAVGARLHNGQQPSFVDVAATGDSPVHLSITAAVRGWHDLPAISVQTHFPLGVFRMWTVFRSTERALIYPSPEPQPPPLPVGELSASTGEAHAMHHSSGDFEGVRAYRRGDALKLVVWKKAATALATGAGSFIVRDNMQQAQQTLWLDANRCGLHTREAQLSRLTAWVLQADQQGLRWGLRWGMGSSCEIAPNHGTDHKLACLRALALAQ